jgi:hypothetical protein
MIDNLVYKFQNRNSKKNLKKEIKRLEEQILDLRKETIGNNRNGWITFSTYSIGGSNTKKQSDDSLYGQLNDIREFLGIDYEESKLAPKPKEENK